MAAEQAQPTVVGAAHGREALQPKLQSGTPEGRPENSDRGHGPLLQLLFGEAGANTVFGIRVLRQHAQNLAHLGRIGAARFS